MIFLPLHAGEYLAMRLMTRLDKMATLSAFIGMSALACALDGAFGDTGILVVGTILIVPMSAILISATMAIVQEICNQLDNRK